MVKTNTSTYACEFGSIALLLQGGGALGAYQAGVYEALAEAAIAPDWIAGISMGAVNGAIIAGNRPENRISRLHAFWDLVTSNPLWNVPSFFDRFLTQSGDDLRTLWNQMNALACAGFGARGFFKPRIPPPWLWPPGSPGATSFYNTDALKASLEKLVDFEILNSGDTRYTTCAVNIRTGNYETFDSLEQEIHPEHIMASGALPPALPPVEIEGAHYWDAGLIFNTPLQMVMNRTDRDTLIFQVDLWSARGALPRNITDVMTREKEIQYSSRTRAINDSFKHTQRMRHAFEKLYERLPEELKTMEEVELLHTQANSKVYNIVQLIYRARHYEGYAKDYEFSRLSMREHWRAGYNDTIRTLRHPGVLKLPEDPGGIQTYDVAEN